MKKKLIATICAVAVLGGAAAAVVAFADRNEELKFNSDGEAVRELEPKTKEVMLISASKGTVTYDKTEKRDNSIVDIYRDANGDEYEMVEGKLQGFISSNVKNDKDAQRISEDEAVAIAMEAIVPYVDDVSRYAATWVKCAGSLEKYSVACRRLVAGVPTDDYVMVSMTRDGQICFVTAMNEGKFNDADPAIVDGVTRELIEAHVKKADEKNELEDYYLAKDENGYYIEALYSINGDSYNMRCELG